MRKRSFFDEYESIISEGQEWHYLQNYGSETRLDELFEGRNALHFIKSSLSVNGKGSPLVNMFEDGYQMDQYRSNHTLSAYLLGIVLRDKLHIDVRELPQVEQKRTRNFLYFWSLTCLYHDIAFSVEEQSDQLIDQITDMDCLIRHFRIEHSLLEKSKDSQLIKRYFEYRIKKGKIDHGIVGAMIIYDRLIKSYEAARQAVGAKEGGFVYQGLHYSARFKRHILLIANTIAKHNMWRADTRTVEEYEENGLQELIPDESNSHRISIESEDEEIKDKLLFLLGLVDTIEPIKCLGRERNNRTIRNPYIVLEKMKISFDYAHMTINIDCPDECADDYWNSVKGIEAWMNVKAEREQQSIGIQILKKMNDDVHAA